MAAQQELEEKDEFNLVKHEVQPGEEVFTPIGKLQPEPLPAAAHSTPIVEDKTAASADIEPIVRNKPPIGRASGREKKNKDKKKNKAAAMPAANVFDLLMASDEPEYNVDDTLPDGRRSKDRLQDSPENNPFGEDKPAESSQFTESKEEDSNPFGEPKSVPQANNQFAPIAYQSRLIEDTPSSDTNPFEVPKSEPSTQKDNNPFDEPSPAHSTPFGAPETPVDDKNPFGSSSKTEEDTNPFGEPTVSKQQTASENPFEEKQAEKSANPFEAEETNPFSEEPKKTVLGQSAAVSYPFENDTMSYAASNPFEDEDDEASSSFNRTGSFARHGSSRFAGSGRNKKRKEKKKTAAPAPPKPERLKLDNDAKVGSSSSDKPAADATEANPDDRLSIKSDYFSKDSPRNSEVSVTPAASVESPRHRYKKDKKAPAAPTGFTVSKLIDNTTPKPRSSSHNVLPESRTETKRRDTDPSRMESIINVSVQFHNFGLLLTTSLSDSCHVNLFLYTIFPTAVFQVILVQSNTRNVFTNN